MMTVAPQRSTRTARLAFRSPAAIGAALTLVGLLGYDLATYFNLSALFIVLALVLLFAGLATLLALTVRWIWSASAGTLAAAGFVLALSYAMATAAPTVFAPPALQGGEREMFRGVPIVLLIAGAILLTIAGIRFFAARLHASRLQDRR